MTEKFPKSHRLLKQREFEQIWRHGKRMRGPTLLLVAHQNSFAYPRLGISAGKKKMPLAVERNRFKRLIREAFRLNQNKLPRGLDLLVIPLRGNYKFSLAALSEELLVLTQKLAKQMPSET